MHALRLVPTIVILLGLAGCGLAAEETVMPDVVGQKLDIALSDIKRAGLGEDVEIIGGGAFGVIDESNWEVCDQEPAAGQVATVIPRLTVDRSCGDDATEPTASLSAEGEPSKEPSEDRTGKPEEADSEPATAQPEAEGILTLETSEDLAALFAGPAYGDSVEAFVEKHHLSTIAFDGHITFLTKSDRVVYSTANIVAGDYGGPSTGPTFSITPKILAATSELQQDDLNEGMNVRITARVGSYYSFEESWTFDPERDTRIVLAEASVERR